MKDDGVLRGDSAKSWILRSAILHFTMTSLSANFTWDGDDVKFLLHVALRLAAR